jgi:Secretion system C-terminal sorting domain
MRPAINCLCLVLLLSLSGNIKAARFWVAAGPSNWNNTANWSNVSGGAGGFSVPGAADAVTFNNARNGNCTFDVPVNIQSITISGYTGTIAQGANTFSVVNNAIFSSGIFSGGSANITIAGNFTLSGATFKSTTNVLEFDGDASFTSGSFIHNNGSVRFNAAGGTTTISGTSPAFFVLEFVGKGFNYNLTSTGNIGVSKSLNLSGSLSYSLNTGTLDVTGDINVTNTAAGCSGTGLVRLDGTGVQNFSGATIAGAGALPRVTINKTSGTLNLFNFPASSNAFTYTAGVVNADSSTYCFLDGSTNPYTIAGSLSLQNMEFLALTNQQFNLTAATTLTAAGDLTMAGTNRVTINTGKINVNGNIWLTNISANGGGTATINIIGSGNETMDGTAVAISENLLPFIVINKPGGTLTLKGIISESQNWTYTSGIVDASGFASTVAFGGNSLNVASAGMSFYNVTVTGNTITQTNNMTILHDLTITAGRLAPVANTINIAGSWNNYGTAGFTEATSTVNFNGSVLQTITSPGGENFNNFTVNNSGAGIQLNGNTTIATSLTMTQGNISLNGNTLTLGLSVANNGTLSHGSGALTDAGTFTRWFKTGVIAAGSVNGLFPMGTATDYRPLFISAPVAGPTTGGSVTVSYHNATTNTNVSITDGASTVVVRKDLNWAVTTNGLAGGTYNLQVQGTGFGLIGAVTDLRLTRVNSITGVAGVNAGSTTDPQINRTGLTLANLTNSFYVGSINAVSTPLPINLLSFNVYPDNDEIKLEWVTASETDNAFFTIQRSKDGQAWEDIQKIPGAGNSGNTEYYTAYDPIPYAGISYYRLMQTDIDGKYTYSSVVSINLGNSKPAISVYPNPASDLIRISFSAAGRYEVSMFNLSGQAVYHPVLVSTNSMDLNVRALDAGIYFIRIQYEGKNETYKILIHK